MSQIIKNVFTTPDGKTFETKTEAENHLRRPFKERVLTAVTGGGNPALVDWLIDNEEAICDVYESTRVRRVTKAEKNRLIKALTSVTKAHATVAEDGTISGIEPAFAFLIENAHDIAESFRWPSVKRGTAEEQAATIRQNFMILTADEAGNGNSELSDWLIANKDAILEAYEAGKTKRQVSEKAAAGLAAYQAQRAALKRAAEAEKAAAEAAAASGEVAQQ